MEKFVQKIGNLRDVPPPPPVAKKPIPSVAERYGLRIIQNEGAGNCGMLVVAHELRKTLKYKDITLSQLRERIATELQKDPEFFADATGCRCDFDASGNGFLNVDAFKRYVDNTKRPGTFTDHAEWVAIRRAFPELPEFVFVMPVKSANNEVLVQSHFGDVAEFAALSPAAAYLKTNGVSAATLSAIPPTTVIIYYTCSGPGHFEATERIAPVQLPAVAQDSELPCRELVPDSDSDTDSDSVSEDESIEEGPDNLGTGEKCEGTICTKIEFACNPPNYSFIS
jgi:hypothetical protein